MPEVTALSLYDAHSGGLIPVPLAGAPLSVFACGPAVLSRPHVGHLRGLVSTDVLRRALRWLAVDTQQIVSIPDIHRGLGGGAVDGPVWSSASRAREAEALTARHLAALTSDMDTLLMLPRSLVRASDRIVHMIELATALEQAGYAYRTRSGLFFDTGQAPGFPYFGGCGELPDVAAMHDSSTAELRNPQDFALWRIDDWADLHAARWRSPWGIGRPGWHLPCSAIASAFGPQVDIHTGSTVQRDFHHCAEIAQSQSLLEAGVPWVSTWLHTAPVISSDSDPSSGESLPTLPELTTMCSDPVLLRWVFLSGHHRYPVALGTDELQAAQQRRDRIAATCGTAAGNVPESWVEAHTQFGTDRPSQTLLADFGAALMDDLNTARALSVVDAVAADSRLDDGRRRLLTTIMDQVLGLGLHSSHAVG